MHGDVIGLYLLSYGGIHLGRVEPILPWVVTKPRSPVPASLHLVALQLKPRFESTGASALHKILFGFSQGTQEIGF